MWLWRKVLNITWSYKVCNEEELRRDDEERAIISVINRRQRVWLGYTLRPPGRPRAEMLDRVKDGNSYVGVKRRKEGPACGQIK